MKKLSRVGLFGGTFNPLHFGHILSMTTTQKKLGLDSIEIIPVYQSPFKDFIERPSPMERLEMLKRGLRGISKRFRINNIEIRKARMSYTIETIKSLQKMAKDTDLFLIIGCDHWKTFPLWKDHQEILNRVHLVVTSRDPMTFLFHKESRKKWLEGLIEKRERFKIHLKNARKIYFVPLPKKNQKWESQDIRLRIQRGEEIKDLIPLTVRDYIKVKNLYVT